LGQTSEAWLVLDVLDAHAHWAAEEDASAPIDPARAVIETYRMDLVSTAARYPAAQKRGLPQVPSSAVSGATLPSER
jgi:hypothetical protein